MFVVVIKSVISSYNLFGSQANLYDEQLFIPPHVRIVSSCKFLDKPIDNVRTNSIQFNILFTCHLMYKQYKTHI